MGGARGSGADLPKGRAAERPRVVDRLALPGGDEALSRRPRSQPGRNESPARQRGGPSVSSPEPRPENLTALALGTLSHPSSSNVPPEVDFFFFNGFALFPETSWLNPSFAFLLILPNLLTKLYSSCTCVDKRRS